MLVRSHSNQAKANRQAVAALALLIAASSAPAAFAQNATSTSTGSYSSSSALGPEEDQLLPPEVVPLDPNSAAAGQTDTRQAQTSQGVGSAPGLVQTAASKNGLMSSQDFRQAAFNSLYNQGQLPPQEWRQQLTYYGQGQNGAQNPNMAYGDQYAQMANNQPAQSQTLTGGPKYHPPIQDIRRGGFTNYASATASLGAAALFSNYLIRPSNPIMGVGMWALMTTGFGTRNGFRF